MLKCDPQYVHGVDTGWFGGLKDPPDFQALHYIYWEQRLTYIKIKVSFVN